MSNLNETVKVMSNYLIPKDGQTDDNIIKASEPNQKNQF
jgi:hypothetical protein